MKKLLLLNLIMLLCFAKANAQETVTLHFSFTPTEINGHPLAKGFSFDVWQEMWGTFTDYHLQPIGTVEVTKLDSVYTRTYEINYAVEDALLNWGGLSFGADIMDWISEFEAGHIGILPLGYSPGQIDKPGEYDVLVDLGVNPIYWGYNYEFDLDGGGAIEFRDRTGWKSYDGTGIVAGTHFDHGDYGYYYISLSDIMITANKGKLLESVSVIYDPSVHSPLPNNGIDGTVKEYPLQFELNEENDFYTLTGIEGGNTDNEFAPSVIDGELRLPPGWMNTIKARFKDDDRYIDFADENVKNICVANWDYNQDGNISIGEAYLVENLGTVFSQNKTITSFDELKYFKGLTSIPNLAFFNCSALKSITIPVEVTEIGQNALSGCSAMTTIKVDEDNLNFTSVDGVLFNKAKTTLIQYPLAKGTNYAVPVGTKTIGRDAFFNSKLSSIFLPSSLTTLEFDALGYCKYLTEINLPSNLQTIGDYAFDHCTGIRSIIIPSSVTSIGSRAFNSCNNLALVECQWTENPSALAADAFPATVFENAVLLVPEGTRQLYNTTDGWKNFRRVVEERNANITFADATVKAICVDHWDTNQDGELSFKEAAVVLSLDDAFTGNTAIKSFRELQFFTALAKIDDDAFNGCKLLTSVIVPDNVREIGKKAFYGCYKLTDITLPEGLEVINDYGISACINLTEINLPSTLTTLKLRAFYYDKKLTSISLPASISSIGAYAFATCDALMEVTANMETPCVIASTVFSATTFSNGTLYVPEGKQNLYRNTNYWSMFTNMVEMVAHATGISANNIALAPGESEKMTLSLNYNVPIVSYQFDVTMPEGLSVGSIESLTPLMVRADRVADATWRFTAYSNNNTVIPANVGGLVSFYIVADRMTETGYKTVEFSDFVMTDESFQSIEVEDCTVSVEVKLSSLDAGKGDVNLDGKVNVQDVVLVLNYIINNNTRLFSMDNADANSDGKINISDVSAIVALSMNSGTMNAAPAHAPAANLAAVTWDTSDGLSLTIGDAHNYVATQMDIITEGTLRLNGITTEGSHAAAWQQIGDNRYRVLVFSNANDTFSAFGPHLFFDMEGDGTVTLNDVLLVDAEGEGYMAEPSSTGYTTGITTLTTDLSAPADVYSVSGQIVRQQVTSLKNLPAGIYIVNGKKMVVK